MIYSRLQFGRDLTQALDSGLTMIEIAKWAYRQYLDNMDQEPGVREAMMSLVIMEEGEGFEMTRAEMRALADSLING